MKKKVIIIGGVAGGASAAARLRRLDESVEILLLERGPYISFANCGLPYHIGGAIKDRDALLIQTPEAMRARFNIDVRIQSEVIAIHPEKKSLQILDHKTSTKYEETYDQLVISTGSSPIRPSIPGIDAPNIFSLWTIKDMDIIKSYIKDHHVKKAIVIGGGFIGLEMVENLHELGIEISLVEMADQVMAPLDFEMAQLVHNHLSSQGIHLYLKNGVNEFNYNLGNTKVTLSDKTQLDADMILLNIGISPNGELAKAAGLSVNKRGGILVSDQLQTSDDSIYAVGDVIEVNDYMTGQATMIPLAGPANKQGRIVADVLCGRDSHYEGSQGTSVAKVFDLTVASTGLNEKRLQQMDMKVGQDYFVSVIQAKSHAGYYPGAFPMTLKIIFDAKGKFLGAQNVGIEGVEKRIDVLASVLRFQGNIYDLQRLELAYAPPYSSAKDPVNMAGYTAENILKGDVESILWRDIDQVDKTSVQILDVREPLEVSLGAIEGSISIPLNDLRDRIQELDPSKDVIVYCAVGLRGYIASRLLTQKGYRALNLIGGYSLYKHYKEDYSRPHCMTQDNVKSNEDDGTPENALHGFRSSTLESAFTLDACGLQCPGPIMRVNQIMSTLNNGDFIKVRATDPGFIPDVQSWCHKMGHTFIKQDKEGKIYVAYLQKGSEKPLPISSSSSHNGSTMVIFSGDLDKALASMIIANGAAAMGKEVTLFFTFWGLNILRKEEFHSSNKPFLDKMFGKMMPKGPKKLKLSKMNMGGMGTQMIHHVMHKKNVNTVQELIHSAMDSGVKFVACTMSMDIMGITQEELIDGIEYGGVATYLGATESSNHNLFI